MAKQKGIVFFEGTMGGINFYYRKGVPTARTAGGGFTREAIKKSPKMARVRESNHEFSGCSGVNKVFKQAIRPFMIGYRDGTLHSRLMQLFLKLKDRDTVSKRGERRVAVGMTSEQGRQLFVDFVFTPKRSVLLPCDYAFDWNTLSFNVLGFDVSTVGFPAEADYMELTLGVIRFDFDTKTYQRVMATPLVLERNFSGTDFSVDISELPGGSGVLFAMARVSFYQEVNGSGYLLPGGGALGFEVVGVMA